MSITGFDFVPCTEKQVSFIAKLCKERDTKNLDERIAQARTLVMAGQFGKAGASLLIEALLIQPLLRANGPVTTTQTKEEPEDGIYFDESDAEGRRIYKVYKMVHGSGRQGVKRLVVDEHGSGKFSYLGLAVKHLPATARRMTLEEAKAFGRLYGVCVRCGATLTDEESIANGIGPVCGSKGW